MAQCSFDRVLTGAELYDMQFCQIKCKSLANCFLFLYSLARIFLPIVDRSIG